MTESVIVHGQNLTVEQTSELPAGVPIRPRPGPVPSTVTAPSAINSETARYTNPFWSDEANHAADNRAERVASFYDQALTPRTQRVSIAWTWTDEEPPNPARDIDAEAEYFGVATTK